MIEIISRYFEIEAPNMEIHLETNDRETQTLPGRWAPWESKNLWAGNGRLKPATPPH